MTEDKIKSDNEIDMELLCRDAKQQLMQYNQARIAKISSTRVVDIYRQLMQGTELVIKELERKGVKRFVVPETAKETPDNDRLHHEVK